MTQGIFIHGSRPKSKKEIKEYIDGINLRTQIIEEHGGDPSIIDSAALDDDQIRDPYGLVIEATSMFGNEFDGSIAEAERTNHYGPFTFVGPDPRTSRKFYGIISYNKNQKKWTVK